MKISFNIKSDKIKKIFIKLPRRLAENSFPLIIFLFFISLALGGLVYYEYVFLTKNKEPQLTEKPFRINEINYQKMLDEWQAREKIFQEADSKKYPDPFNAHAVSSFVPPSVPTSTPSTASSSEPASATNPTLPVEP